MKDQSKDEGIEHCGMVLKKYDHSESFTCAYCHKDKTSRKVAFEVGNPNFKICNACYGEIISKFDTE